MHRRSGERLFDEPSRLNLNDSRLVTAFFTFLKAGPAAAGGRRRAEQRRDGPPGHRPHRPPQPAPTPHPDRHVVLNRPWAR